MDARTGNRNGNELMRDDKESSAVGIERFDAGDLNKVRATCGVGWYGNVSVETGNLSGNHIPDQRRSSGSIDERG